jgi:hypothetical protein
MVQLEFVNESGDGDVVIFARRDSMPERDRVRLKGLPVGARWSWSALREQSGVHIFSIEIGADTCLSAPFDTARSDGQEGARTATFTVRGSSVVVVDSFADAPYTLGAPLGDAVDSGDAGDGTAQLEVGPLLGWQRPTMEEARRTSAHLVQRVPSLRPGLVQTKWEDELEALLKQLVGVLPAASLAPFLDKLMAALGGKDEVLPALVSD